jgi:PPP family 3-phenylpropionic acid transporter
MPEVWRESRAGVAARRGPAFGLSPCANGDTIGAVIALRFLVLALGAALGVFYPFLSVVLKGFGFSAGEIGAIASIGAVGFTVAVPAWGHLADVRLGRPRTLQVCAIGGGLAVAALLLPWPGLVIAVLFAAFWVFESSWQPLADAITVNALRGRDYGRVRLLTSLSFSVASILAGFLYNETGYRAAFVLFGLAALAMTLAAAFVPDVARADLGAHRGPAGAPAPWRIGSSGVALRVAPRLAFVLGAVTLLFVGVISGFTFLPLRMEALGGSPSDIALASGGAAAAEIPTMLVAAWVARRIGLRGLFVGSALVYAFCLSAWAVSTFPLAIIVTRTISGIGYAGVIVAVVLTIAALLPAELQATGQSLFQTTAFGIAAIVANVVGGILYDSLGHVAVFGLAAVMALASAALGWFAFPLTPPIPGAPRAGRSPSAASP